MENKEAKNEALIGGSALNAGLVESAELQCSYDNSKNLDHPCSYVDPDMRYWCENCLTKALESNAVLLARRKRASTNAKSQATDAALSRQVACTDGLGIVREE